MDHKVTTDYTRLLGNANVKVYVRARPCADDQKPPEDMFERNRDTQKNIVIKVTGSTLTRESLSRLTKAHAEPIILSIYVCMYG